MVVFYAQIFWQNTRIYRFYNFYNLLISRNLELNFLMVKSTFIIVHYITIFKYIFVTDRFSQYDYGANLNMHHYNSTVPPVYDLKSIQVPITLMYGENDILADKEVKFVFAERSL